MSDSALTPELVNAWCWAVLRQSGLFTVYPLPITIHPDGRGFTVTLESCEVLFDDLATISSAFGTRSINLSPDVEERGDCDSCHRHEGVVRIHVKDVTVVPSSASFLIPPTHKEEKR